MKFLIGLMATVAISIGLSLGLSAGFVGGRLDSVVMRIADVQLTFPAILTALLIDGVALAIFKGSARDGGSRFWIQVIAIGLSYWVQYARTVRGATLVERNTLPGSLKVSMPGKVYANSTATIGLTWSGVDSGKRYVGALQLFDPNGMLAATTVVSVNTDNAIPAVTGVARKPTRASPL